MPPKDEHRSIVQSRTSHRQHPHRHHHHASSSKSDSKKTGISSQANSSSSIQLSSTTMVSSHKTSQYLSTTTHHSQKSVEGSYLHYDRLWKQSITTHNHVTSSYASTPMQRWQTESMLEEPYHAIDGASVIEGHDMVLDFEKLGMDYGQAQGLNKYNEGDGSIVVDAESEKWPFWV